MMRFREDSARTRRTVFVTLLAACAATQALAQQPGRLARTQMAYPTGDPRTSVVLLERIWPAEVRSGKTFEYELKLTNLTDATIHGITLTEQMPNGLTIVAINPQAQRAEGGVGTWYWETLGPRASAVIRIQATAGRTGEVSSCASITFQTQACASMLVVQPALQLVKNAPAEVVVCDPIPVTITVTNTGSGVARNVRVVDPLPAGWTTSDGQREVAVNIGDLLAGQAREVSFQARAQQTGNFMNTATATEDGGLTAQDSTNTRITRPVLALSKTGPNARFLGRPATFDLTVRNAGDTPAANTVLTDNIPAGTSFVSASDGGQFSGGRVIWSIGTLGVGESRTVSVTVATNQIGSLLNTASARAYCADAEAQAVLEVRGIPAILLEVIDVDDPIELGANETYEITVLNQGSAPDTNIVVTCTLPPQQEYVSATGPTQPAVQGKTIAFGPLPSLAPKATAKYRVIVKGIQTGDVRFKLSLTSDQLDSPVDETESTHIYE